DPLHRAAQTGFRTLVPVTAQDTMATAIRIGDPVSWPRAKRALLATRGLTTSATEPELVDAMHALDAQGLFACPHTATAYAGLAHASSSSIVDDLYGHRLLFSADGAPLVPIGMMTGAARVVIESDVPLVVTVDDTRMDWPAKTPLAIDRKSGTAAKVSKWLVV